MVNPHDTPSEHSRDWDKREKADEERRTTDGSGDNALYPKEWRKSETLRSSPNEPDPPETDVYGKTAAERLGKLHGQRPSKRRSRKIAAIIISIFFVAIIGMFLFGDGMNPFASVIESISNIPGIVGTPFADITESVRGTMEPCKVYDSILISSGTTQGKISLKECKKVLTVSGNLNESAQVHLTFLNPDKKPVHGTTFVTNEINYPIGKDLYDKQAGIWSIRVTVNGVPQGILEFIKN